MGWRRFNLLSALLFLPAVLHHGPTLFGLGNVDVGLHRIVVVVPRERHDYLKCQALLEYKHQKRGRIVEKYIVTLNNLVNA